MLAISNIFGHGFAGEQLAAIERAGFGIRPTVSRYAGTQMCRFIDFEDGPALELIEVEDEKAYLDFVPLGMKPYAPGINLVIEEFAERNLEDFERKHADLRPYRLHVNYDGSDASVRPGWNYLNFALPIIRDTFVWLTELDEPRPRRPLPAPHPNGARGVAGLVFDLDAGHLQRLAQLLETKMVDGHLMINEVDIWSRDALADPPKKRLKASPLAAVVVETDRIDHLPHSVRQGNETTFRSRPAVDLETNDLSWDLLIAERLPPVARLEGPSLRRVAGLPRRV